MGKTQLPKEHTGLSIWVLYHCFGLQTSVWLNLLASTSKKLAFKSSRYIFEYRALPLCPPHVHLTSFMWWMLLGLPHFHSHVLLWTQKQGRPGNEATIVASVAISLTLNLRKSCLSMSLACGGSSFLKKLQTVSLNWTEWKETVGKTMMNKLWNINNKGLVNGRGESVHCTWNADILPIGFWIAFWNPF